MQKVLCLLGPTASGKSAAALALAQQLPIEIITLDSAQVYVGMDIGTAKPSAAERAVCPHHLIDIITPLEAYSAARFIEDCTRLVGEIVARNRVPVIAGGTMLYFKALREGLAALPGANPDLRAQLRERAQREGWPALHAELAARDPASAARLAPLDAQRIERALEIVLTTGAPVSEAQRGAQRAAPFDLLPLALVPSDRAALHARIAARFDAMLREGLVDELAALKTRYPLHAELPAIRCVGYRQAWSYLEGDISREALRDQGIFATRQLAKRQLTWLRSTAELRIVDCLAADACHATVEAALRLLEGGSGGLGVDAFVW